MIKVVMYKQFFSGKNPGANQTLEMERQELISEIKDRARSKCNGLPA